MDVSRKRVQQTSSLFFLLSLPLHSSSQDPTFGPLIRYQSPFLSPSIAAVAAETEIAVSGRLGLNRSE